MTLLDIVIVVILGYNAFMGAKRGLVKIIFDLITISASVGLALYYFKSLEKWTVANTTLPTHYAASTSFAAIFVTAFLIFSIITFLMSKSVDASFLGPLNHLVGFFVGVAKGVVLALLLLVPMSIYSEKTLEQSTLGRPVGPLLSNISGRYLSDMNLPEAVSASEKVKETAAAWKVPNINNIQGSFKRHADSVKELGDMFLNGEQPKGAGK